MDNCRGSDQGVPLRPRVWNMKSSRATRNRYVHRQDPTSKRIEQFIIKPRLQPFGLNWVTPGHPRNPNLHFQNCDH